MRVAQLSLASRTVFGLFATLLVGGCNKSEVSNATSNGTPNVVNNASANVANNAPVNAPSAPPAEAGKVGITTTKAGTGVAAAQGSLLVMRYTGRLKNGTVFDSNMTDGKPGFSLVLGQGSVIPGWEEGLIGIKAGEHRTLNIPSAKGYGERGAGEKIGPNQDLIFDVVCLAVLPKEKQETVTREEERPGTGGTVKEGQSVTFHYIGKTVDGTEFDNSYKRKTPLTIKVGKGQVPRGL
ncbi:MAG: hypothetical protein C4320_02000, partial [Armatimonadota bacterium]